MEYQKWFNLTKTGELTQEHINEWLSEGHSIDEQKDGNFTALMTACNRGHYEVIRLLIENGADVNIQCNVGWSLLMFTCDWYGWFISLNDNRNWKYWNIFNLLIENNANPYLLNRWNRYVYDFKHADNKIKKLILEYHPYYLHKLIKKIFINKIKIF